MKIATSGHQYTKTTENEQVIFCINAQSPIEKKSNQDWNAPIHLNNNGPYIKVSLIFLFLLIIFYFCFYHRLWVKLVCLHIGSSSVHIELTHSLLPKYLWMFDTDCKHIKLTSSIICVINDKLTNSPSTPHLKEKTVLDIAHVISLFNSINFHLL